MRGPARFVVFFLIENRKNRTGAVLEFGQVFPFDRGCGSVMVITLRLWFNREKPNLFLTCNFNTFFKL
jgi:hypothetical protein